jgi:hypothetical protein
MNYFAVYPSGDPRNLAGTREDSEVVIEWDADGVLFYIAEKSKAGGHKIYFQHNNSIVTAEEVPGDFARRVFERDTLFTLWRNPTYYKPSNKITPEPESEDEEPFQKPPAELMKQGRGEELNRWMARFPKYFATLREDSRTQYLSQHGNLSGWKPTWEPPKHLVLEIKAERSRLAGAQVKTEIEAAEPTSSASTMAKPLARPREEPAATATASSSSSTELPPATSKIRIASPESAGRPIDVDAAVSEIANEIVAERQWVQCPNPNCAEKFIDGTLICDRCNSIIEEVDWDPDDPLLTNNNFHYYLRGENAVIDELLLRGDPSVILSPDANMIIAQPAAVAKASNVVNVQAAAEVLAACRISEVTRQAEDYDPNQLVWSTKEWDWVDLRTIRQEDYNNALKKGKKWYRNNHSQQEYDRMERSRPDWVTLRLEGDDEYLQQCVLRDKISSEPHKKNWDIQNKALDVARRLGKLEAINAWCVTFLANAMRARAEESCSADAHKGNNDDPWTFVIVLASFFFIVGMLAGALLYHICSKRRRAIIGADPPVREAVQKRDVGVQSQTTYTSLRGVVQPRFHPLAEESHGAFM